MFGGPLRRLRSYFWRRRALYAAVTFTFGAGVLLGGVASDRIGEEVVPVLEQRVVRLWQPVGETSAEGGVPDVGTNAPGQHTAPAFSGGPSGPFASVVHRAVFDAGGVVYTIGMVAVLGISIVGAPFVLAIVFWRGFTIGFAAAFLVQRHLWRGFVFAVAALAPYNAAAVPALIAAAGAALSFAGQALTVLFGPRGGPMRGPAVKTALLWTGCGAALLAGSLLEAYVTPTLLPWLADALFQE